MPVFSFILRRFNSEYSIKLLGRTQIFYNEQVSLSRNAGLGHEYKQFILSYSLPKSNLRSSFGFYIINDMGIKSSPVFFILISNFESLDQSSTYFLCKTH